MNKRLDGRVAVITGGAGRLGAATAERMVAEDARVVIADIDLPCRKRRRSTHG